MKRIYLIGLLVCCALSLWAEGQITGTVVSQTDGTVVEMATIRLFSYQGKDSTLVQGAQSDLSGHFLLQGISAGKYRLWVSSVGYQASAMTVTMQKTDVSLGTIRLKEDIQSLQEVKVTGKAAEMIVKGDTIEYNTAAYKVSENAMVEDLLKKMNGVTVDKQGNVTVNGENITAVRIDGKKFFGNDVQSATKNIPADMIEKVQVIDEKSDLAKMTGFEDDESEHIINLTLKKNRQKGIFGKYTGGLGMDLVTANGGWFDYGNPLYGVTAWDRTKHFFSDNFRYNANLFTNILLGESQTTILGSANNTNEVRMGRGRGDFGMGANSGITWSESLGANTNLDFTKKIHSRDAQSSLLFGGDVALNHSYNDTRTEAGKTSYAGDITYDQDENTNKQSYSTDVNARLELEYQIDTLNKILIQPTISYTGKHNTSHEDYTYFRKENELEELINQGEQAQVDTSKEVGAQLKVTYNHKFTHPGRSLTIVAQSKIANTTGLSATKATGTNVVDQHTQSTSNDLDYSLKASYVEPLGKANHLLEISASFTGKDRWKEKNQYSWNQEQQDYTYDDYYSNQLSNHIYSEQMELNYRWIAQKSDLTLGLRGLLTQTRSQTYYGEVLAIDTLLQTWNLAPNIKFRYKFGKKEFLRLNYRGSMQHPTLNQLTPVRNNSNAMRETVGNLSLTPAFSHRLNLMYSRYNQDRFSSIMTGLRGTLTQDALVSNTIYDETGKQYQQTVNADALPWSLSGDLMYNTPLANKMLQLNSRTSIGYQQQVTYILQEQQSSAIKPLIDAGNLPLGNRSQTGRLSVSQDLSLRFVHDIVDVGATGRISYNRTENDYAKNGISNVLDWTVTGDIEFHLPKNWNIQADCGYTARLGYSGIEQVNEVLLNASIEKSWANATLSLSAYDLLHQKKNIVQVVSENSISYEKYNTLPTYVMLTFTYKMNKMGDLKAKGAAGFMQEMIENGSPSGPPSGNMPPMGPPPGM